MLSFIKKLFGSKPVVVAAEAPYKVEAPAAPMVVVAAPAKKPRAKKATTSTAPKKPRATKAK